MNKTRIAIKCFAGTIAAGALVIGSLAAPAQAAKDTGWGPARVVEKDSSVKLARDTGWGPA